MQILLTGGFGFIGSNLVRLLLTERSDISIVNLDALTYAGHQENLLDVADHPRYKFIHGRIENVELVEEIVSGKRCGKIDGIINVAAETHVDRSITHPMVFIHSNVLGTQVLLEAAVKYGGIRYLQVSTDEVYGSLGPIGYFTEQSMLAPNSPYSASKAGADMLVRSYNHTFDLPTITTRCSNNYGPYQHPEKLIPLFIKNALEGKPVPLYGDGRNVRDWLHVEDHCRAIALAFEKGRPGEVYNVGGNCEHTNIEIARLILQELGRGEELISFVQDRRGHDRRYAIDSSKIRKELGWTQVHKFEGGIRETISWYKNNQAWLHAALEHSQKQAAKVGH